MKRLKIATWVLLFTTGLCLLAWGTRGLLLRTVASHWQRQLAAASDEQVGVLVSRICALGDAGIPALVGLLGSRREVVARTAHLALVREMDRWESLGVDRASPKLAILAAALAEEAVHFGPTSRLEAARLTTRILLCPLDGDAVDRAAVLADCQQVLRATTVPRRLAEDRRLLDRLRYVEPGEAESENPNAATRAAPGSIARNGALAPVPMGHLPALPGGGLPIETFPGHLADEPGDRVAQLRREQPRRLASEPPARPLNPLRQPRRFRQEPEAAKMLPSRPSPRVASPEPEKKSVRPLSLDRPLAEESRSGEAALTGASMVSVAGKDSEEELLGWMRRLLSDDEAVAREARDSLIERGFSEVHLQLARQLFDPDPDVRMRLARTLPGLRSIDARPWLLRLAADPHADVRLTAITLLATTGDPDLLHKVIRLAEADPDPRIQAQAQPISQGLVEDPYEIRLRRRR
jgi:hypothetical protein